MRKRNPKTKSKAGLRRGFTLVEVLAAILLLAIVLPVVERGIISASNAGSAARYRTEAASLAQSKLAELTTTATWSGGQLSGDFGNDWKAYRWSATVVSWPNDPAPVGMEQLDVTVTWQARGRNESLTVSTLVYSRPVPTS
jgi:general secretion pathway protein I